MNTVNAMNNMNTVTKFQYQLDRTSKKFQCHSCKHKTFVQYVDISTGEYLASHVGRCDRENHCGYHFTPKQYFAETNKENRSSGNFIDIEQVEIIKTDFLPKEFLSVVVDNKFWDRNNFFHFLTEIFTRQVAISLFRKYLIGTSGYWKGATVFPQIDHAENLRQIKIILYDRHTGKRIKDGATVERFDKVQKKYVTECTEKSCSLVYGKYIDETTRGLNLEQCFFGEHLLSEYPDKPVCIVESEKTAIVCSVYLSNFIWLATGGASGCKWRDYAVYKVLEGRTVTFFPDYGFFNKKSQRTCFDEWKERCDRIRGALPSAKIRVSDVLEKRLSNQERQDQDLADLLLIRDKQTGLALEETGYPIIFDYKQSA